MSIVHHDLCFGCGVTNLFGLQMELDPAADGVSGRFFVKQDHQGSQGAAHSGVVAAALDEAMELAVHAEGITARPRQLSVRLEAPAPVGAFVRVEARIHRRSGEAVEASATATGDDGAEFGSATARFIPVDPG